MEPESANDSAQLTATISLSDTTDYGASFRWWAVDGTATSGFDYEPIGSGTVSIPANADSVDISLPIFFDWEDEETESVFFYVEPLSVHAPEVLDTMLAQVAESNILDFEEESEPEVDDGDGTENRVAVWNIQSMSLNSTSTTAEPDIGGEAFLQLLITFDDDEMLGGTVEWEAVAPTLQTDPISGLDLTATSAIDFGIISGTFTVSPGVRHDELIIQIPILPDSETELSESLYVQLKNPSSNTSLGASQHTTSITDRTTSTGISVKADIPEADEAGNVFGKLTFSQSALSGSNTLVLFSITGSATYGTDYYFTDMNNTELPSGSHDRVTIPTGSLGTSIKVVPLTDEFRNEGLEKVTVTIDPSQGTGPNATATVSIRDAANRVTIEGTGSTLDEDEAPTFSFTVKRWGDTTNDLYLRIVHVGSATYGIDYTRNSGGQSPRQSPYVVRILAGSATAQVNMAVKDDGIVEPNGEVAKIKLSPGANYTVDAVRNAIAYSIIDDDLPTTISISATRTEMTEQADSVLTFTRTGNTTFAFAVQLGISGSVVQEDYLFQRKVNGSWVNDTSGIVNFIAGSTTTEIRFKPVASDPIETDETITITTQSSAQSNPAVTAGSVSILLRDIITPGGWVMEPPPQTPNPTNSNWRQITARNGIKYYEREVVVAEWIKTGHPITINPSPALRTGQITAAQTNSQAYAYQFGASVGTTLTWNGGLVVDYFNLSALGVPVTLSASRTVTSTVQSSLRTKRRITSTIESWLRRAAR